MRNTYFFTVQKSCYDVAMMMKKSLKPYMEIELLCMSFCSTKTRPSVWYGGSVTHDLSLRTRHTPDLGIKHMRGGVRKLNRTIFNTDQQQHNSIIMSSYMQQSCFVTEPLVRFFPTQACGNQCKVTWSRVENLACAHGVRRSPQCGGDCRRTLSEHKLCPHATVFCSLCGESRWPEHSCYCFNERIDKRWVFLVTLLHGHN